MTEPADLKSGNYTPLEFFSPYYRYGPDLKSLESLRIAIKLMEQDFAAALNTLRGQLNHEYVKLLMPQKINAPVNLADGAAEALAFRISTMWLLMQQVKALATPLPAPVNVQGTHANIANAISLSFLQMSFRSL